MKPLILFDILLDFYEKSPYHTMFQDFYPLGFTKEIGSHHRSSSEQQSGLRFRQNQPGGLHLIPFLKNEKQHE